MHELIHNIALAILAAWILGVAAQFARQPLILAYLAAGFLLGPAGFAFIADQESITTIAELGLIFLLFMIGLEIDLKKIMRAGQVIIGTASVQIVATCLIGVLVFRLIGLQMGGQHWDALYLAVAAALSSTVIIVKMLYEKFELDTLPGRITLGVLVLQDVFVILFLAVQPSLTDLRFGVIALSIARVAALIGAALLVSRYVLPHLFHRIARLPELVLVGALAWCFLVSEVAVYLSLSREMGALVAGVALSTFPYALDVTAKITSLRDFFITLFFVGLGMTIPIPSMGMLWLAAILVLFTVATRIVTVALPLYLMKRGLRASIVPAINLCQLSEFSLVVMQLGVAAKQVSAETSGAVSLAFVVLAVASTFAILHSDTLTRGIVAMLKRLGVRDLDHSDAAEAKSAQPQGGRIMLLGFYRAASSLLAEFERQHIPLHDLAVIDFNPNVHEVLTARGARVHYGDISHRDILAHCGVADAKIVISSLPDSLLKGTSNERLVREVRALNPAAKVIATAELLEDVATLYAAGADYVIVARLSIAGDLFDAIKAAEAGLLADKRTELDARLAQRGEVLP